MKLTALAGGRHRAPLRPLPAMDLPFLVLVLTLVGFGLVMLGSASGAVALYRRGDALAYLRPQMLYAAMGIAGMGLASRVDLPYLSQAGVAAAGRFAGLAGSGAVHAGVQRL